MVNPQPPSPAELSSLSSSLEDIARRVRAMAEQAAPGSDEDAETRQDSTMDKARAAAADLWEVERLLRTAQRRLSTLSR